MHENVSSTRVKECSEAGDVDKKGLTKHSAQLSVAAR